MGIDPGTHITGYGIIDITGRCEQYVTHGEIKVKRGTPLPHCLRILFETIQRIIAEAKPQIIALEEVFYGKNVQSLLKQSHARGVIILAAAQSEIPLYEYSPLEVKKAVVGYGRAEKLQVQHMIKAFFNLPDVLPQDASDALAVAICHSQHQNRVYS